MDHIVGIDVRFATQREQAPSPQGQWSPVTYRLLPPQSKARNVTQARSARCRVFATRGWPGTASTNADPETPCGPRSTSAVAPAAGCRRGSGLPSRRVPADGSPDAPALPGRRTDPAARQARSVGRQKGTRRDAASGAPNRGATLAETPPLEKRQSSGFSVGQTFSSNWP